MRHILKDEINAFQSYLSLKINLVVNKKLKDLELAMILQNIYEESQFLR